MSAIDLVHSHVVRNCPIEEAVPGLIPGIHILRDVRQGVSAGSSQAMTEVIDGVGSFEVSAER